MSRPIEIDYYRIWASVPLIGDGTDEEPYRPDFSTIENDVAGWAIAGTNGETAIAYVVTTGRYRLPVLRQYIDVIEVDEIASDGTRARIPERTREAVGDRFRGLDLPDTDLRLEYVDVNPAVG